MKPITFKSQVRYWNPEKASGRTSALILQGRGGMGFIRARKYQSRLRSRLEELAKSWATPSRYRPPMLHRQHWADRIRQGRAALRRQRGSSRSLIPQH
jgi:hypothetical protein